MKLRIYISIIIISFNGCKFTYTSGPKNSPSVIEKKRKKKKKKIDYVNIKQTKKQTPSKVVNNESIEPKKKTIDTIELIEPIEIEEEEEEEEEAKQKKIPPSEDIKNTSYYNHILNKFYNYYQWGTSKLTNQYTLGTASAISKIFSRYLGNKNLGNLSQSFRVADKLNKENKKNKEKYNNMSPENRLFAKYTDLVNILKDNQQKIEIASSIFFPQVAIYLNLLYDGITFLYESERIDYKTFSSWLNKNKKKLISTTISIFSGIPRSFISSIIYYISKAF